MSSKLLVWKWIETILKSNACLFACKKGAKFRCVCVFRNLSEHSIVEKLFYAHFLFISSARSLISTPTNEVFHKILLPHTKWCMKFRNQNFAFPNEILCEFCYANKILSEISLSMARNAMQNFARFHEISIIWEQ